MLLKIFNSPQDSQSATDIIENLLSKTPSVLNDERVTKIVEYIKANYFQPDITPQTFTDLVFLSPSRLAALFKKQTGSSLSKYLLWTRLLLF